jgi:hypothetical protein
MRAQRAFHDFGISRDQRPAIRKTSIVVAEPMPGERDMLDGFLRSLREDRLESLMRKALDIPDDQRVQATKAMAESLCQLAKTLRPDADPEQLSHLAIMFASVAKGAKFELQVAVVQRLLQAASYQSKHGGGFPSGFELLGVMQVVANGANLEQPDRAVECLLQMVKEQADPGWLDLAVAVFCDAAQRATPEQQRVVAQRLVQVLKQETDP